MAMELGKGLICSFSPSGDTLAIASSDGRVRTFDTGTGRLRCTLGGADSNVALSSLGALAETHTCLTWVVGVREKVGKKKATDAAAAAGSSVLVVGTAAGDVKAFDTLQGELKWRCKNAVEGGVTALAFGPATKDKPAAIYAAGPSCQLVALDPTTGAVSSSLEAGKQPITCMAISSDATAAFCGGTSLALWDLAAQERRAKFTGHPTPAHTACFVPGAAHVVSASPSERHVAVWTTAAGPAAKKSKKAQPAAACLSLEDPALQVDTSSQEQLPGSFHVAAVSSAGEAYVWACQVSVSGQEGPAAGGEVKAGLLARVRVGAKLDKGAVAGGSECILAVKLQPGSQGPSLLVARGSSAKPVFESVALPLDAPLDATAPLVLQPCANGVLLPGAAVATKRPCGLDLLSLPQRANVLDLPPLPQGKGKAKHNDNDMTVLGPENGGQAVMMRSGPAGEAAEGSGRKRPVPEAEAEAPEEEDALDIPPEDELPLGQRVSALESGPRAQGPGDPAAEEAGPSGAPEGSSKADSLAVLLTQALRSNDRALLEKCLSTSNARIITNTVRRLVPTDAAQFLKAAVDRVLTRPARAVQLAPWIKALMHCHTGYMMSAPGVRGPLTALYQAIEGRVGLYQQMLRVYGRLNLVTAHLQHSAADGSEGGANDGLPGAEVVFEDDGDDDEEPDAEDAFAPEDDDEGDESGDEEEEGSDLDLEGDDDDEDEGLEDGEEEDSLEEGDDDE